MKSIAVMVHVDRKNSHLLEMILNHIVKVPNDVHIPCKSLKWLRTVNNCPGSSRKDRNEFYLPDDIEDDWWISPIVAEIIKIMFWYTVKILGCSHCWRSGIFIIYENLALGIKDYFKMWLNGNSVCNRFSDFSKTTEH